MRQYLKKNNIFYETVPMFVTVAVIVMVSGYFIVVNYRIATKVIISLSTVGFIKNCTLLFVNFSAQDASI